jgi:hypothetical protein
MRTIDLDKLRYWLAANGPLAKEDLASKARIKFFTLDKIVKGLRMPTELEQRALCEATGILRDDLFPTANREKAS